MQIILGSKSPRRHELLKAAGISFLTVDIDCDENFSDDMDLSKVAEFLAVKKSLAYKKFLQNTVLITADTTVVLGNKIFNKPVNEQDAIKMLGELSGKMHQVFTGVCIRWENQKILFTESTKVYFKALSEADIQKYVEDFKPLDKAGAYGIQDWIGYVGIEKIEGDFYNVMGLPIHRVYESLKNIGLSGL